MRTWFTVKMKYTKHNEDGTLKKVSEAYLFDAGSFTEAEARAIEEVAMAIKGEVAVTNIAKTDLADIIQFDDSQTWYKVKVSFISFDEKTEKETRQASNVLVNAPDIIAAVERTQNAFKDSISAFEILAASVSPIVEIYAYDDSVDEAPKHISEVVEEESSVSNSRVFSAPSEDEEDGAEIIDEYSEDE